MLNQSCIANTKPMMRMAGKSSARLEVVTTVMFVTIFLNIYHSS